MPEVMYVPRPLIPCTSPSPCPDPCDTEAVRLKKQTQCICGPVETVTSEDVLLGLVAYWAMEENSVPREDSHTGGYDLALAGSDMASTTGIIGNAARPQGSPGNYMQSSNAVFEITGPMTITTWFHFDGFVATKLHGISKADMATDNGYELFIESQQVVFKQGDGATTAQVTSPTVLTTGIWYFIAVGYDGTNVFAQVNAGTRATAVGMIPGVASEAFRVAGGHSPFGAGGQGFLLGVKDAIDETGIWNRALSTDEVSYLYNSGAGRTYPFA